MYIYSLAYLNYFAFAEAATARCCYFFGNVGNVFTRNGLLPYCFSWILTDFADICKNHSINVWRSRSSYFSGEHLLVAASVVSI